MSQRSPSRTWLLRGLLTTLALALWWALARISPADLMRSLTQIAWPSLSAGLLFGLVGIWIGGLRWQLLLRAFGASYVPSAFTLSRLHLIALFYNTFLPANVMGDVLRAHLTRGAFDEGAAAYLIVLLERVFGLAGLLLLTGVLMGAWPLGGLASLRWVALVGIVGAVVASVSPLLLRTIGSRLPGTLGAIARRAPTLSSPSRLMGVVLLSVLSQVAAALIGYSIVQSFAELRLVESMIVFPVALVATYAPTIAGLGAREAAFVVVLGRVGLDEGAATATSLAYLGVQIMLALLGGLLHLIGGQGPTNSATVRP